MRRLILSLLTLAVACSWSRFDEYKSNTPMFALSNKSFGARLAFGVDPSNKTAFLMPGGSTGEGARFFFLNDGSAEPNTDPNPSQAICELNDTLAAQGRACIGAKTIGGIGATTDTGICFAIGYGHWSETPGDFGPLIYCTSNTTYTLGAPGDLAPTLKSKFVPSTTAVNVSGVKVSFAILAGSGDRPLLFGDESDETAFVYPSIKVGTTPAQLTPSAKGGRFGAAVAVGKLKTGDSWYAVSAPGKGLVYVYRAAAATGPYTHVGCAKDSGGSTSFGDTIAAGDLDGDGNDELLVSNVTNVALFDGATIPATSTGECADLLKAFSTPQLACTGGNGCSDSARFGASIAVGDLNGDGKAEVAVGAPGASPDGIASTGAVYLFTPSASATVQDVRYVGNPEADNQFGASVAIGKLGGQDTLAVGAQGKGVSYIAWCTGLSPGIATPRCRK